MKAGDHLGYRDHEIAELFIFGEVRRGVSRTATLDFRRAEFSLDRSLVERDPWEAILKGREVQKGCQNLQVDVQLSSGFSVKEEQLDFPVY